MYKSVFFLSSLLFCLSDLTSLAQVVNPANKKFNVYKIDVNPNATKDGLRGISAFFSCEYLLSDAEYNGMKNAENKVRMTFYASIGDAAGEAAYQAYDYPAYKKQNNYVGTHFADEIVLMPQNKAQGLRSTGIELFVPFASTSLPEGNTTVTFALNAYNEKAGRYENIHTQKIAVNKPATYAVTLQAERITVIDKAGKRQEVGRIEQDLFALPGAKPAAKDIAAFANVDVNDALQFTYCEGDVVRLGLRPSIQTGVLRRNKPRLLRTRDNKPLPAFDNAAALSGEWPFDTKAAQTLNLKTAALDLTLAVRKYRIPAVQLSAFKVNPFATHDGVAGTSVSFDYKATVAGNLPPLTAWLTYQPRNTEQTVTILNGKVLSGQARLDTTGTLTLDKTAGGRMEVFYPSYQILLQDPDVRRQPNKRFALQIRLGNNPYVIARKETRQDLTLQTLREASLPVALKLRDTLVGGVAGVTLALPVGFPKLYFDTPETKRLDVADGGKDGKTTEMLRKMTLLTPEAQRVNNAVKTTVSYELKQPRGAVRLFLPYTSLTKIEEKPVPIRLAAVVADGPAQTNVGESIANIQYQVDRAKLRFVSVGIANIKLKEAKPGNLVWRIRSKDKVLYESKPIAAAKLIENLYTDAFYIHEDDTLVVELLKGTAADNMKTAARWEKPVKALTAGEQIEIDPAKQPNNTDDGDTRSLTVSYTAQ